MYCISKEFLSRMHKCIGEIEAQSKGVFAFVEYIPLPHFGTTILRFDLDRDVYTLDDLDGYESSIQGIVGDEFLVDFMGSVYQKVGFEPWMYEEKFRACYHRYKDVPIIPGAHHSALQSDAASLLEKCGLSPELKVWEIQLEESIALFVLGEENREIGTYVIEDGTVHVCEVEEMPCIGLMRAIMHAKKQNVSLVRVLLEACV